MNRIAITLNEHGELDRICSDEVVEVYIVDPKCKEDRVYLYGAVETGPQFVRQEIGGYVVGHANDGTLGDNLVSPKLPPSTPTLKLFSNH